MTCGAVFNYDEPHVSYRTIPIFHGGKKVGEKRRQVLRTDDTLQHHIFLNPGHRQHGFSDLMDDFKRGQK
jgi:hypothetical protein